MFTVFDWLCAQALQQPQSAHTAHSPTLVESCVVLTWIYSTLGESPFCKSLLSQIVLSRVKGNKVLKHNFCNKFQEFNHFLDKVVVHARVFVMVTPFWGQRSHRISKSSDTVVTQDTDATNSGQQWRGDIFTSIKSPNGVVPTAKCLAPFQVQPFQFKNCFKPI